MSRDFRYCDQLRAAAASGSANIAEAFGCYQHGDAPRYVRIAKASLTETAYHLRDAVDRGHWTAETVDRA